MTNITQILKPVRLFLIYILMKYVKFDVDYLERKTDESYD